MSVFNLTQIQYLLKCIITKNEYYEDLYDYLEALHDCFVLQAKVLLLLSLNHDVDC